MFLASIPSDPATLLLALFAVFGLPLLIFGIVVLAAGYMQHSATQDLEDLEAELDARDEAAATDDSDDRGMRPNDASDRPADR